jgi:hypothetical protein
MAVSRTINNEVAYAVRTWLASVPSLDAPAAQRSYFQLLKVETFELMAAVDPSVAAQVLQLADKAQREAHAISLNY